MAQVGPVVLGRVFSADGLCVHELDSAGRWSVLVGGVPAPGLAAGLESAYRGEFAGPAYGPLGSMALHDLARHLGGRVEYVGPVRPAGPDIVF